MASKLVKAVEQVIHQDQMYWVPGRSIMNNTHLIRDVLDVSSSLGLNTGLISIDQEMDGNGEAWVQRWFHS